MTEQLRELVVLAELAVERAEALLRARVAALLLEDLLVERDGAVACRRAASAATSAAR